jgi:hypothetical protein
MYEKLKMFPCQTPILCECQLKVSISDNFTPPIELIFLSRINVKLGGINTIPDPSSVSVLTDPHNPTIVMGEFCFSGWQ